MTRIDDNKSLPRTVPVDMASGKWTLLCCTVQYMYYFIIMTSNISLLFYLIEHAIPIPNTSAPTQTQPSTDDDGKFISRLLRNFTSHAINHMSPNGF